MNSGEYPSCRVQVEDNKVELEFLDDMLHRQEDLERVYADLEEFIESVDKPEVEMNLSSVKHILSESLGWFIHIARVVRNRGGVFRVVHVHDAVYRALEVARFTELAEVEAPGS